MRAYRHTGPVWQVAWGHPSFGTILASCSYDSRVYVWKEKEPASGGVGYGAGRGAAAHGHPAEWEKIKEHAGHSASGELRVVGIWRDATRY